MSAQAKRLAKVLLGEALAWSGFWNRTLQRWAQRHTTIILSYHRVLNEWDPTLDYSQPGMVVTASTLDRQFSFLKEHFDLVPLSDLVTDGHINRQTARPRCVITFDDGWRDNYELAFQILRRHGLPATVFLTADFIGTERAFWHTELAYLLLQPDVPRLLRDATVPRAYPAPVRRHLTELAKTGRALGAYDVDPVIETVKAMCDEESIEELLQWLSHTVRFPRPLFRGRKFFLDWEQVREMADGGIEIGSHTCSHRILTRLSTREAMEELVRSKAKIEGRVGQSVQHFAFPNGAANESLLASAATAGYRTACIDGLAGQEGQVGILALRRLGMHEAICGDERSFNEALLRAWLFRAPQGRRA